MDQTVDKFGTKEWLCFSCVFAIPLMILMVSNIINSASAHWEIGIKSFGIPGYDIVTIDGVNYILIDRNDSVIMDPFVWWAESSEYGLFLMSNNPPLPYSGAPSRFTLLRKKDSVMIMISTKEELARLLEEMGSADIGSKGRILDFISH